METHSPGFPQHNLQECTKILDQIPCYIFSPTLQKSYKEFPVFLRFTDHSFVTCGLSDSPEPKLSLCWSLWSQLFQRQQELHKTASNLFKKPVGFRFIGSIVSFTNWGLNSTLWREEVQFPFITLRKVPFSWKCPPVISWICSSPSIEIPTSIIFLQRTYTSHHWVFAFVEKQFQFFSSSYFFWSSSAFL
jgi:hypothetical protein